MEDRVKKLSKKIEEAIDRAEETLLEEISDRLQREIINLPVDLSAIAPEHITGVKEGHKQARHRAVEKVLDIFADYLPR
jgi:Ni,Fe-hydrogenase maturation factor